MVERMISGVAKLLGTDWTNPPMEAIRIPLRASPSAKQRIARLLYLPDVWMAYAHSLPMIFGMPSTPA
jgi:hypothetical protein